MTEPLNPSGFKPLNPIEMAFGAVICIFICPPIRCGLDHIKNFTDWTRGDFNFPSQQERARPPPQVR